jgi:predicted transcriptional regulator
MSGMRFTAYLSDAERAALRRLAEHHHVSENYIVRLALRQYLQLSTVTHSRDLDPALLTTPKST